MYSKTSQSKLVSEKGELRWMFMKLFLKTVSVHILNGNCKQSPPESISDSQRYSLVHSIHCVRFQYLENIDISPYCICICISASIASASAIGCLSVSLFLCKTKIVAFWRSALSWRRTEKRNNAINTTNMPHTHAHTVQAD